MSSGDESDNEDLEPEHTDSEFLTSPGTLSKILSSALTLTGSSNSFRNPQGSLAAAT